MSPRARHLVCSTVAALALFAPPLRAQEKPSPLPDDVVRAWQEAGATPGWTYVLDDNRVVFTKERPAAPGHLPAFQLASVPTRPLARLPRPAAPFGLVLQ